MSLCLKARLLEAEFLDGNDVQKTIAAYVDIGVALRYDVAPVAH